MCVFVVVFIIRGERSFVALIFVCTYTDRWILTFVLLLYLGEKSLIGQSDLLSHLCLQLLECSLEDDLVLLGDSDSIVELAYKHVLRLDLTMLVWPGCCCCEEGSPVAPLNFSHTGTPP